MYTMYAADILDIPEASSIKTEAYLRMIYKKVVNLPRPTFPQFVAYLLRIPVEQYNDHWRPYWLHCHVCEQEFDVVGKFETIQEDTKYVQGVCFVHVDKHFIEHILFRAGWIDKRKYIVSLGQ